MGAIAGSGASKDRKERMADNNNGKQRQINGLVSEDKAINLKLDLLQSSIEDVHDILTKFIAPGGVCDKHRQLGVASKGRIDAHDKLFGIIIGILAAIVGLSVKVAFF